MDRRRRAERARHPGEDRDHRRWRRCGDSGIPHRAVGLTLYTASYIAEIVRGGIQAVAYGQHEAAAAIGLTRGQEVRLVLLPQALRVIIPPITSQY
jgi:ABC-type amino acid transport system permease subunit